jgi:hypothetical protein
LAEDALPRFRIRKVTGHDGADTAAVGGGGVELVEAEFGFAIAGVAAVAGETIIGEDRAACSKSIENLLYLCKC